jgi:hypothetical protein
MIGYITQLMGLAANFSPEQPEFRSTSVHVGLVAEKVAMGQVFSKYFDFPCQFSFHQMLHFFHLFRGWSTRIFTA